MQNGISHKIVLFIFFIILLIAVHFIGIFLYIGSLKGKISKLQDRIKELEFSKEKLRKKEDILNCITKNSYYLITLINLEKVFMYVNCSHEHTIGYDYKELLHKDFMHFVHKDDKDKLKSCVDEVIINGNEKKIQFRCIHKSGSLIWLESMITPIYNENKEIVGTMFSSSDITDKKHTEEALKQSIDYNKSRTEFFTNISHDLKAPINVIISAQQMISFVLQKADSKAGCKEVKKYVDMIKINSLRLIKLVNNLIDMTKMETGYVKLNLENYNVVEVVENITMSIVSYSEAKDVQVIFDTDVEEKIMAFDEEKMERIMLNLLSNAVKFTESGGQVLVSLKDQGDKFCISVKDTGMGVPYEEQKNIFNRFVQVNTVKYNNYQGSGIGLSLVKFLVELHGGSIKLNSKPGEGTEFLVTLPVNILEGEKNLRGKEVNFERIKVEFSDVHT